MLNVIHVSTYNLKCLFQWNTKRASGDGAMWSLETLFCPSVLMHCSAYCRTAEDVISVLVQQQINIHCWLCHYGVANGYWNTFYIRSFLNFISCTFVTVPFKARSWQANISGNISIRSLIWHVFICSTLDQKECLQQFSSWLC